MSKNGLILIAFVSLSLSGTAQAQTVFWEGVAYNNDGSWEASGQPGGTTFTWTGSGTRVDAATNFANVNSYVNSPDFDLGGAGGDSFGDKLGDAATEQNATWEMVFRPGDFSGTHHLFNTGGNGDGTAIVLLDNMLEFRFQDADSANERVVTTAALDADGADPNDFVHVVGVADVAGQAAGIGSLFVNGELIDMAVSAGTIDDWDGNDLANLGSGAGDNFNLPGDNPFVSEAFDGDIALFRFYQDQAFNADEVSAAFEALGPLAVPEPTSIAIWSLIGFVLCGLGYYRIKRK